MGSAHDFPSGIEELVARTLGQIGPADEVIAKRTILPFYLAFSSEDSRTRARAALRGRSIGALKFQLGILTSRFRAHHPLKACPSCMAEDQREHSVAFWHIEHQLPGVWVCHRHGLVLMATALKSSGKLRFHWLLPDAATDLGAPPIGPEGLSSAAALSRASVDLWKLASQQALAPQDVIMSYRHALARRGFLTKGAQGQLRHRLVGEEYARYLIPLRGVPELAALPANPESAAAEIARLLRAPRCGIHPVRHLAFMTWCFGSLRAFMDAYRDSLSYELSPAYPEPPSAENAHRAMQRDEVLRLLELGQAPTAAARTVGVDPSTAMAWATSRRLATSKRPSRMLGETRIQMIAALRTGCEKSAVAARGGVSVESVTRLLRTEVGLREEWARARRAKAQAIARGEWLQTILANRHLGTKGLRLLAPAAYAWLYRNDRDWLDQQAALLPRLRAEPGQRVDWDQRDERLAQAVRVAALELGVLTPGRRITLANLCARVPELRAKIRKLSRLPRTERVLDELATRRSRPRRDRDLALL